MAAGSKSRRSTRRVVSLARSDTNLAALLESGDWMLLWDDGSSNGSLPEDGAKLLMLGGGDKTLWAIAAAGSGRTPTTKAATQQAATIPKGTLLLYRLDRGQWTMIAPLPPSAPLAKEFSLAVLDGAPVLAELQDGGDVRTFAFNTQQKKWEATARINADANTSRIKLLGDLEHSAIWTAGERGGGVIHFRDAASPVKLAVSDDVSISDVAAAGQNIRAEHGEWENSRICFRARWDGKREKFSHRADCERGR